MERYSRILVSLLFALGVGASALAPNLAYASDLNSPVQVAKAIANAISTNKISISSLANAAATKSLVTKAFILDPAAWITSQTALQGVVKSTVNWANSGFNGGPAAVTNLGQHLQTTGDTAALNFFTQYASNGAVQSPFRDQVSQQARNTYLQATGANGFFDTNAFTLNKVTQNPQAFLKGDFSQGGFNAFFAANQMQNNYLGAYELALTGANDVATNAQSNEKNKLIWSNGYKDYKGNCKSPTSKTGSSTAISLSNIDPCYFATTITSGAEVYQSLSQSKNAVLSKLVSANSLGQIAGNFLTQFLSAINKGGLSAANNPSAQGSAVVTSSGTDTLTGAAGTDTIDPTTYLQQTVGDQILAVRLYQTNWQELQTVASTAQSCSNDPVVTGTLTNASTALGTASSALTQLQNVQTELAAVAQQPAGAQQAAMDKANNDFNMLFSGTSWLASNAAIDIQTSIGNVDQTDPTSLIMQIKSAAPCAILPTPSTTNTNSTTGTTGTTNTTGSAGSLGGSGGV